MKNLSLLLTLLIPFVTTSQDNTKNFNARFKKFMEDPAFRHAQVSLFIVNQHSGSAVTEMNIETGLAPASCQKVITSATAYDLLGHDFKYKTQLGYTGKIENGTLQGDVVIKGSGDPTLGSWRYAATNESAIIAAFKNALSRQGINKITGHVIVDDNLFSDEATPDGWIWQDIGNYYGAGARALNWRENQYDLYLSSGKNIGDPVKIASTKPSFVTGLDLKCLLTTAAKGTGDNANIYIPLNNSNGYVRGTIPAGESAFSISGSMPHPAQQLAITLEAALNGQSLEATAKTYVDNDRTNAGEPKYFYTYSSPPLDSIMFYFLRRSINLYGEALIKTLGTAKGVSGTTNSGADVIRAFWKDKGIDAASLNVIDGSGLSPANRITTRALVTVMEYARKQSWYSSFYEGLPTISSIKMKSGSINGVVSYTGYINGKDGNKYTFAFIINNYDGNGNDTRKKMWSLLGSL